MTERRKKGEIYWYVSFDRAQSSRSPSWGARSAVERDDAFDQKCFEEENYYLDQEEAKEEASRRNIELGLDVGKGRRRKKPEKPKERDIESEKDVERYLVKQCMNEGWIPLKYSSGISTGYPDRCILIPGGRTVWVEVKTTGQKPTKLQQLRLRQLEQIGFSTRVVDSKVEVDRMISMITEAFLQPRQR